jgi:hypothetical protein
VPANLIATGPRRGSPALLSESGEGSGGSRLKAEDATNLAERLAVAGGEVEATRDGGGGAGSSNNNNNMAPLLSSSSSSSPVKSSPEILARQPQQMPAAQASADEATAESNPFRQIAQDPALYKQVVLRMALQRQAFDEPRVRDFTVSPVIGTQQSVRAIQWRVQTVSLPCLTVNSLPFPGPGFFWRDYPPLEEVLHRNMADYFDVSAGQRQSKLQQSFTRNLLNKVREVAEENGWTFSGALGEKVLRDRIRCFYKTHLQNAKKRLVTLQKHPDSPEHRSALRVYVRSVRLGISVEASQLQEQPNLGAKFAARAQAPSVVTSPGCIENDGRPTIRRGEIFTTLQKAHQIGHECVRESHGLSDASTTVNFYFSAGASNHHSPSNGHATESPTCA